MNTIETITENKIIEKAKSLKLELIEELISLQIIEKKTKKLIFKIEDFESFEHMPELIEEEQDDIENDGQIEISLRNLKIRECIFINSIYKSYHWILFSLKDHYFIGFFFKKKSLLQINRNFIKIAEFLQDLNFFDNQESEVRKLIQNYFFDLIQKNALINKMESDKFQEPVNSMSIKTNFESELDMSLNEIELKFFSVETRKKNYFYFNKKLILGIFLLFSVFILFFYLHIKNSSIETEILKNNDIDDATSLNVVV